MWKWGYTIILYCLLGTFKLICGKVYLGHQVYSKKVQVLVWVDARGKMTTCDVLQNKRPSVRLIFPCFMGRSMDLF